jgi:cytochrome P450
MTNLYQRSAEPDPTSFWRELRTHRVTHALLDEATGQTVPVLSRYEDVRDALGRSGRTGDPYLNRTTLMPLYEPDPGVFPYLGRLGAEAVTAAGDPPLHPAMRSVLDDVFPWRRHDVGPYQAVIEAAVEDRLSQVERRGTVDLTRLATELPLAVILSLIGAPPEDWPQVLAWSDGQLDFIWGRPEPAEQVRLVQNLVAFWEYCIDLSARTDLRPDSITARLHATGRATVNQVASFVFNLLVAGHETTRNLIANTFLLLLSRPDRWRRVIAEPDLVPLAVAESNRFLPAIVGWLRETAQDVAVGDVTLPAGTRVLVHIGAANRDMPDGDTFDVGRRTGTDRRRPTLSFGAGPHYCVGAQLALREAEIAVGRIARRRPDLRLADAEIGYAPNLAFRGPRRLVAVTAPSYAARGG